MAKLTDAQKEALARPTQSVTISNTSKNRVNFSPKQIAEGIVLERKLDGASVAKKKIEYVD